MAKSSSEGDFLNMLRGRENSAAAEKAAVPKQNMVLHTPPTGKSKSLDELLATESASEATAMERGTVTANSGVQGADGSAEFGFKVPLAKLKQHPWNARIHRSPERIRELATSMAATRQNNPISITPDPAEPGAFFIVDGDTRYKAAQQLNWNDIWALEDLVDATSPVDLYVASFRHTEDTEPISPIDMGVRWAQLMKEKLATQEVLAERLGVHQTTISRMMSYSRFTPRVLDFMRENKERFSYSIAGVLAAAIDTRTEDEMLALCQRIVNEEVSRRAIEALLKQKDKSPRSPRRSAVVSRPIRMGEAQVGMLRTYETGAIEFKLVQGAAINKRALDDLVDVLGTAADLVSIGHENFREALIERLSALTSGPKGEHD